jgi:hypothetical protein
MKKKNKDKDMEWSLVLIQKCAQIDHKLDS